MRFPLNESQVQFLRGRYSAMLRQFVPLAYQHYQGVNSPQISAALADVQLYADAVFNLFTVFIDEQRYEPDESETRQLAFLLMALSQYLSLRGLWAESLRWGRALLERSRAQGWSFDPVLLAHLGKAYLEQNDPDAARQFSEQALEDPALLDFPKVKAVLHTTLSAALFGARDYEGALAAAVSATEVPLPDEDPALHAEAWAHAVNALIALRQYADALKAAQTAYTYALKLGRADMLRLVSVMALLAQAHTANGSYARAAPLYEAAIAFYDQSGDEPGAARVRYMYAVQTFLAGDLERTWELTQASLFTYERYAMSEAEDARDLLRRVESTRR